MAAPGTLAGGAGQIVLTPTGPGSINVCADLGADHGVNCVATGAGLPWLQGKWPGAATFDNDPRPSPPSAFSAPRAARVCQPGDVLMVSRRGHVIAWGFTLVELIAVLILLVS
jgi:hypothetical protein